jgi:hypothetical protein
VVQAACLVGRFVLCLAWAWNGIIGNIVLFCNDVVIVHFIKVGPVAVGTTLFRGHDAVVGSVVYTLRRSMVLVLYGFWACIIRYLC